MTRRGETITMLDDEGLPHDFTLVEVVEIEDRRYAVLQPEDPEAGAVLFRVEGETMRPVDDEEEFDQVVDALRDLEDYDDFVIEDGAAAARAPRHVGQEDDLDREEGDDLDEDELDGDEDDLDEAVDEDDDGVNNGDRDDEEDDDE